MCSIVLKSFVKYTKHYLSDSGWNLKQVSFIGVKVKFSILVNNQFIENSVELLMEIGMILKDN